METRREMCARWLYSWHKGLDWKDLPEGDQMWYLSAVDVVLSALQTWEEQS